MHPEKAKNLISVTLPGIVTEVRREHSIKAPVDLCDTGGYSDGG